MNLKIYIYEYIILL
eukprot:UN05975